MPMDNWQDQPSGRDDDDADDDVVDLTQGSIDAPSPLHYSTAPTSSKLTHTRSEPSQPDLAAGPSRPPPKPPTSWALDDDDSDTDYDLPLGLPASSDKPPCFPSSSRPPPPAPKPLPDLSLHTSDIDSSQPPTTFPAMSSDDDPDLPLTSLKKGKTPVSQTPSEPSLKRPRAEDVVNVISSELGGGGTDSETAVLKSKRRKGKTEEEIQAAEAAKLEKQRVKEEAKRAKEEAKLAKQVEKQRLKEEQTLQKTLLQSERKSHLQANKKRDKDSSIKEMIVSISPTFIISVGGAIIDILKASGAEVEIANLPVPCSIQWRRRITREWDDAANCWTGCKERVKDDDFALVWIEGREWARV
ncbi:hypothetical protein HK097_005361, partial [Rhizophlyctis rosea]